VTAMPPPYPTFLSYACQDPLAESSHYYSVLKRKYATLPSLVNQKVK
jgi:hypothetical protein